MRQPVVDSTNRTNRVIVNRRAPITDPPDTYHKSKAEAEAERKKKVSFGGKARISMDPLVWHKVAAISGIAALGLGTYGAHGFRPKDSSFKQVWQTASLYHLTHTVALLGAPLTKRPHIFGGLLTTGILLFSGTCYAVAYFEDRKYSRPAPLGGVSFIAAWASLLL